LPPAAAQDRVRAAPAPARPPTAESADEPKPPPEPKVVPETRSAGRDSRGGKTKAWQNVEVTPDFHTYRLTATLELLKPSSSTLTASQATVLERRYFKLRERASEQLDADARRALAEDALALERDIKTAAAPASR